MSQFRAPVPLRSVALFALREAQRCDGKDQDERQQVLQGSNSWLPRSMWPKRAALRVSSHSVWPTGARNVRELSHVLARRHTPTGPKLDAPGAPPPRRTRWPG